jgi:hypothetical protein
MSKAGVGAIDSAISRSNAVVLHRTIWGRAMTIASGTSMSGSSRDVARCIVMGLWWCDGGLGLNSKGHLFYAFVVWLDYGMIAVQPSSANLPNSFKAMDSTAPT